MTAPAADAARPIRPAKPIALALRLLKVAAVTVGLGGISLGAYSGVLIWDDNFHAVRAGVLYRSAQPSGADLRSAAQRHGIRSVLNLRGANPGSAWYDEEIAASRALGLVHYDYALSARRFVTGRQIGDLIAILRAAPKPLLIHCMSGADRAGLVAALYRYAVMGVSAADADRELSLVYGHFPYLTSRTGAMDRSFWAYVRDSTAGQGDHNGQGSPPH
ncbi:MAG TPA: dual specificity protein phosphatase family protein [Stellaceae bacterium]|nr:dual specificity protein phosphatase family protein [Stellaceae bacterium]